MIVRFPKSGSWLGRLWAAVLVLTFSSTWALQVWAYTAQQTDAMSCCRRGKVHSCCKRSRQSPTDGPALTASRTCRTRCASDFASAVPTFSTATVASTVRLYAPVTLSLEAVLPPVLPANDAYPRHLYQRPPPALFS